MLLEMAKRRALEVIDRGNFIAESHLYRDPIDAQWLGTGLGFALAKGWAECVGPGKFDLTEKGKSELARMRFEDTPRMPDQIVPTKLSNRDREYFTFALRRAG